MPAGTKSLSWLRPSILWQSRNDIIANFISDPTAAARARWVELARQRVEQTGTHPGFVISRAPGDTVSMIGTTACMASCTTSACWTMPDTCLNLVGAWQLAWPGCCGADHRSRFDRRPQPWLALRPTNVECPTPSSQHHTSPLTQARYGSSGSTPESPVTSTRISTTGCDGFLWILRNAQRSCSPARSGAPYPGGPPLPSGRLRDIQFRRPAVFQAILTRRRQQQADHSVPLRCHRMRRH